METQKYYKIIRANSESPLYYDMLGRSIGEVCKMINERENTYTLRTSYLHDLFVPKSWAKECDEKGNELTAKRYFVVLDGYAGYYNNHLSLSKPCELVEEDGDDVIIKVKGEDMVFSRDMCRECDANGNFLYEYDEDLGREVIPTEEDEWMNTPLGSYAPTPTEYDYDAIANHLKTDMEYDRRNDDSYIRRFPSGAVRGDNRGRPKPHWVSPYAVEEISMVLVENSNDFGALNYLNGICEEACLESLCRHVEEAKEALLVKNNPEEFRKVMRSVGFNAVAALHTIVLKEKGLYTKIYEQTEYIKK